jgi:Zn ribbon nucleic-acid-binding protein
MLNLSVYKNKDLQNFIAIINQCEGKGVTEIRFVREKIQNHLDKEFMELIKDSKKIKKIKSKEICPSCKKGSFDRIYNEEGLNLFGCKKCRYSEIRE